MLWAGGLPWGGAVYGRVTLLTIIHSCAKRPALMRFGKHVEWVVF